MAQPTIHQVHPVDLIATGLAQSYANSREDFAALKVFPPMLQSQVSGKYGIFTKNDFFRDEMQRRAPGTEAEIVGFGISTARFSTDTYAVRSQLDQQTRAANQFAELEMEKLRLLAEKYLIRLETQWTTDFMTTGIWGGGSGDYTVANQWSDYALGDPRGDVIAMRRQVHTTQGTGRWPNTMVIGGQVKDVLRQHPQILTQNQFTSADSITLPMIARFFEFDNIYVADAIKATNKEGVTGAYAPIFGKNVWMGYVSPGMGPTTPETATAGRTVFWDAVTDGLPPTGPDATLVGVTSWFEQKTRTDNYELQAAWDNVLTASDLGVFASAVVA